MTGVLVRNLIKKYGALQVIHGVGFDIADGEFIVLIGPSGCGKSTILRMIAGLEEVSGGDIIVGNTIVNDMPPRDRDVAMVFQDYALYPHMSVRENMGFGLKMRSMPRAEIKSRVDRAAGILQIEHLLDRKPKELSGGQRQRVAMGRAIVREPQLFLFDEPLSNLDAKLRIEMRTQIKKLHMAIRTTSIYVTHDQVEAMTLADRIVILRDGVIEQIGTPDDLYRRPANLFVAGFIGSPSMNFLPAQLVGNGDGLAVALGEEIRLPLPPLTAARQQRNAGREITFGIRPEHLTDGGTGAGAARAPVQLPVEVVEPLGSDTMIFSRLGGREVIARVTPDSVADVGGTMTVYANMDHAHLFDRDTERAL
jgi:multiple sugar transport system ATP-binding protein